MKLRRDNSVFDYSYSSSDPFFFLRIFSLRISKQFFDGIRVKLNLSSGNKKCVLLLSCKVCKVIIKIAALRSYWQPWALQTSSILCLCVCIYLFNYLFFNCGSTILWLRSCWQTLHFFCCCCCGLQGSWLSCYEWCEWGKFLTFSIFLYFGWRWKFIEL